MPVRSADRIPAGVTVLGTRLTYRQAATGAGALLLVLLLIVLILANVLGDDDRPTGTDPKAAPSTAATANATPSAASTTSTSPSSAPPSSAPPSSAAPAGGLPAGWYLYEDGTGFKVPIWKGASITRRGSEVYFSKNNRLLIVDQTDDPKSDPVADWEEQEEDRSDRYNDYHKIKIAAVSYPPYPKAADWEFTYTTDNGNPQHAVKRGVVVNDDQAYGLSWYTSPGDWAAGQRDLQLIYQGFQPRQ